MIIFHHIPKTAGSTFHQILSKQYSNQKIFSIDGMKPAKSMDEFLKLPQKIINDLDLIKGHLANDFYTRLQIPFKVIVFIREPIDLFLSSFYYIRRAKHNISHNKVKNMTLEDFISFREANNYHNIQARHLCGFTDIENRGALIDVDVSKLRSVCHARMLNIDYLFTTEKFNQALLFLHQELLWKRKPYYFVRNKTTSRPSVNSLSDNQVQRILKLSSVDIDLYNYACNRCNDLFNHDLEKTVDRFTLENKIYSVGLSSYDKLTTVGKKLANLFRR